MVYFRKYWKNESLLNKTAQEYFRLHRPSPWRYNFILFYWFIDLFTYSFIYNFKSHGITPAALKVRRVKNQMQAMKLIIWNCHWVNLIVLTCIFFNQFSTPGHLFYLQFFMLGLIVNELLMIVGYLKFKLCFVFHCFVLMFVVYRRSKAT